MSTGRQVLCGARVFSFESDGHLPPIRDVVIDNGKIIAVGERLDTAEERAERINLNGHLLVPGFVNAHYHSHDVLAKGFFETTQLENWGLIAGPIANGRSLDEVRVRTLVGAIECLRNGITTVQDFASFAPMTDEYVDTILDAYREVGIRVIFSITVRDRSQLETIQWAQELVSPELRDIVGTKGGDPVAQLDFIERQIDRVGDRDGMVIWAISPSAPQRCSPALLKGVADLSRRRNLPVYTHVYETRTQRMFVKEDFAAMGGSIINYMESVGLLSSHVTIAHGVWPDANEIEKLAASGTGVVLNMLSNLRLRSGVAPISAYRRLGVPLALGCDNCSCSDVQSMFQVMKLYCLLGGLSEPEHPAPLAIEALSCATRGGARSAGQEGRLGAIKPGMLADLIALDLNDPAYRPLNSVVRQLVYAETGRAIRGVWVNGRRVVDQGQLVSLDEARLNVDVARVMPTVKAELRRLRENADKVAPAFDEIQRRTWAAPLEYDRYLQRN